MTDTDRTNSHRFPTQWLLTLILMSFFYMGFAAHAIGVALIHSGDTILSLR